MGSTMSPQNTHFEILTPNTSDVTLFADKVFEEIIKLKWGL